MNWADLGIAQTYLPEHVILIRLFVAALLGGAIGFEREAHSKAAGLRTHMLVGLASALFTVLTIEIYAVADQLSRGEGGTRADPVRAISAVTAGIAFLGAGSIFQQRGSVRGLTTAAAMWLSGAIGICAALGFYFIAMLVTIFALVVLRLLKRIDSRMDDDDEDAGQLGTGV